MYVSVGREEGCDETFPKNEHFSHPWRIHELARDFRLEDVWALPTPGGPDDFPRLVRMVTSFEAATRPTLMGLLFAIRLGLGRVLGWDRPSEGDSRQRLRERLPDDLRASPSSVRPALGFDALYQLPDEWAAEIVNRTVHGVIHLGWVSDGEGGYRGQMAILVKPNGLLGEAYMVAIAPFRYLIVYPRMSERIGQQWFSYSADRS